MEIVKPLPWQCKLNFHKWTIWLDAINSKKEKIAGVQLSYCLRCNVTSTREHSSYFTTPGGL